MDEKNCSVCGVKLRKDNARLLCKAHRQTAAAPKAYKLTIPKDSDSLPAPASIDLLEDPFVFIRLRQSQVHRLIELLLR